MIFFRKSEHVTSVLEFPQWFPTNIRIKSQIFSMAHKVLCDLALACLFSLLSLNSCPGTALGPQWISHHSQMQQALVPSAFARAVCTVWNALPHYHQHLSSLLMPLCSFILGFLSKFLLSWVRTFPLWSHPWIPILLHLLYYIIIVKILSDPLLECELLASRTVSSSSLYPHSFALHIVGFQ